MFAAVKSSFGQGIGACRQLTEKTPPVIPAQAGIQNKFQKALIKLRFTNIRQWIPTCAGMTVFFYCSDFYQKNLNDNAP
uniref:Uncharacterized protein n=1 Tax=Conchiformibius kuhniae TaxID=211502 RepID=A0A8T9MUR6_9NEIS|nr:hypothetical protein LVJ77_05895 [Conchiformibius kuhniae]